MRKRITKTARKNAKVVVAEWKASGLAGRRYKGDDTDAWAVAIIRTLSTMTVCEDASKAGKRQHVTNGGDYISEDWYGEVHPAMNLPTRPDQGVESRMLTNVGLTEESVGWGWVNHPDHGFCLVRTA